MLEIPLKTPQLDINNNCECQVQMTFFKLAGHCKQNHSNLFSNETSCTHKMLVYLHDNLFN